MSSSVIKQQSSGIATETQSGLVSTGDQTFAGVKTFTGQIITPNTPKFCAHVNAALGITAVGTDQIITFGSIVTNIGNCFDNNRFTAPITGIYQLNANITMYITDPAHAARYGRIHMFKNGPVSGTLIGTGLQHLSYEQSGGNYTNMSISVIVSLAANDYVEIYAASSAPANTAFVYGGENACQFSGYLM